MEIILGLLASGFILDKFLDKDKEDFDTKEDIKDKKVSLPKIKKQLNSDLDKQYEVAKFNNNNEVMPYSFETVPDNCKFYNYEYDYSGVKNREMFDNIFPNFNKKDDLGEKIKDGVSQSKLELFSKGEIKPPKPIMPFFKPAKDRDISKNIGTSMTDQVLERMIPSKMKKFELPFEQIKVKPMTSGLKGTNDLRILPKTIDELRSKLNPKKSYEAIIPLGKSKIRKRGKLGAYVKKGPDRFKINTLEDLRGARSFINKGPLKKDIIIKDNKINQNNKYIPNPKSIFNKKMDKNGKIKISSKKTFDNDFNNKLTFHKKTIINQTPLDKTKRENLNYFINNLKQKSKPGIIDPNSFVSKRNRIKDYDNNNLNIKIKNSKYTTPEIINSKKLSNNLNKNNMNSISLKKYNERYINDNINFKRKNINSKNKNNLKSHNLGYLKNDDITTNINKDIINKLIKDQGYRLKSSNNNKSLDKDLSLSKKKNINIYPQLYNLKNNKSTHLINDNAINVNKKYLNINQDSFLDYIKSYKKEGYINTNSIPDINNREQINDNVNINKINVNNMKNLDNINLDLKKNILVNDNPNIITTRESYRLDNQDIIDPTNREIKNDDNRINKIKGVLSLINQDIPKLNNRDKINTNIPILSTNINNYLNNQEVLDLTKREVKKENPGYVKTINTKHLRNEDLIKLTNRGLNNNNMPLIINLNKKQYIIDPTSVLKLTKRSTISKDEPFNIKCYDMSYLSPYDISKLTKRGIINKNPNTLKSQSNKSYLYDYNDVLKQTKRGNKSNDNYIIKSCYGKSYIVDVNEIAKITKRETINDNPLTINSIYGKSYLINPNDIVKITKRGVENKEQNRIRSKHNKHYIRNENEIVKNTKRGVENKEPLVVKSKHNKHYIRNKDEVAKITKRDTKNEKLPNIKGIIKSYILDPLEVTKLTKRSTKNDIIKSLKSKINKDKYDNTKDISISDNKEKLLINRDPIKRGRKKIYSGELSEYSFKSDNVSN